MYGYLGRSGPNCVFMCKMLMWSRNATPRSQGFRQLRGEVRRFALRGEDDLVVDAAGATRQPRLDGAVAPRLGDVQTQAPASDQAYRQESWLSNSNEGKSNAAPNASRDTFECGLGFCSEVYIHKATPK